MYWSSLIYSIFTIALIVASIIDLKSRIIPDEISLGGLVVALTLSAVFPQLHKASLWWQGLGLSVLGMVVGGGFLWFSGWIFEKILKKEAMGGGDIKLLAMIGALLGWEGAVYSVAISSVSGSVAGLWLRFAKGEAYFPYGPHLALGAIVYAWAKFFKFF